MRVADISDVARMHAETLARRIDQMITEWADELAAVVAKEGTAGLRAALKGKALELRVRSPKPLRRSPQRPPRRAWMRRPRPRRKPRHDLSPSKQRMASRLPGFRRGSEAAALMRPSEWAKDNLIVPDGPRKLDRWDPSLTPYIAEPLDLTSTDSPVNEFCVMKSAQTGFTTMLLAAVGHTIDLDRADMMIVQPTDGALSDFNSKKLQPSLEETKATAQSRRQADLEVGERVDDL